MLQSSTSSSSSTISNEEKNKNNRNNNSCIDLNLKETELRLGLPGSESPDRRQENGSSPFAKTSNGYSLAPLKNPFSGSKRCFLDAIDKGSDQKGIVSQSPKSFEEKKKFQVSAAANENSRAPASKAQVVGWPPIRSFRKNIMATNSGKIDDDAEGKSAPGCLYVKVSMDGAPYLRKVDLNTYNNYGELLLALQKMFGCFTIGPGQSSSHGLPAQDGLSESRLMDLVHGSEYVLTYEDKDGDWMLVGDFPWEMFTDACRKLRITKSSEAIGLAPRPTEKSSNQN